MTDPMVTAYCRSVTALQVVRDLGVTRDDGIDQVFAALDEKFPGFSDKQIESLCVMLERASVGWEWAEPDDHICEDPRSDPEWDRCEACIRAEREREGEHYAKMMTAWAERMAPVLGIE